MLRMHAPHALRFRGFELDDRDTLAVVGGEALVRDVARHAARRLAHPCRPGLVLLLRLGLHSRTEHCEDHFALPVYGRSQVAQPGGTVAWKEGRFAMRSYHSTSRGCPGRHCSRGLRASRPSVQPKRICSRLSGPCITGWPISRSQTSKRRRARSVSCRMTVGERSFSGRASSRFHTEMPSTRLVASPCRRRASHGSSATGTASVARPS